MVGSPLHAEVLHLMPNSRELEEEREKRILLGLLHKYLPSLRALPSISQARSSSSLRISRCRPVGRPRENYRLLQCAGDVKKIT